MTPPRDLLHLAHNALNRSLDCIQKKELRVKDLHTAYENAMVAAQTLKQLEIKLAQQIAKQPAVVEVVPEGLPPKTGD